ncbi:MAG: branched-chain amino acid transferase [Acidiferrobacteraceae bacterium]|nr:branched-chain amino acid transferase [Acidiferrobacteraceae bacterium]|tara:strand:- start:346 stop:1257 length:912 start_codon:yes stop_codon:yes gene_type:complete
MNDTSELPGFAFIDDTFVPIKEARIPILDWGFLRSDATYDVVHVWQGSFFRLNEHLDRFFASMSSLRLDCGYSKPEVASILGQCVMRAGLDDSYVEMTCTRGHSPTFSRDPRDAKNRFIAFSLPFSWIIAPGDREEGLNIAISNIRRIPPEAIDPAVKNYHWLDLVMGLYNAYDRNAQNVILTDGQGNVTEGPGFNIFVISNGVASTPETGMLEGVTRQTAIELLEEINVPTTFKPVPVEEVKSADEVFVTSTAGGIMAVTTIDGKLVGNGRMGTITRILTDLYWNAHDREEWCDRVEDVITS